MFSAMPRVQPHDSALCALLLVAAACAIATHPRAGDGLDIEVATKRFEINAGGTESDWIQSLRDQWRTRDRCFGAGSCPIGLTASTIRWRYDPAMTRPARCSLTVVSVAVRAT